MRAGLFMLFCACSNVSYRVDVSPAATAASSASVFGAFYNGRMDVDFFTYVAPDLAKALASERCDALWGESFKADKPALYAEIAHAVRESGPSASVIGPALAMASGELVLVVNASGRMPRTRPEKPTLDDTPDKNGAANSGRRGGGMGGGNLGSGLGGGGSGIGDGIGRGSRGGGGALVNTDRDPVAEVERALDLSAELFTVKDHASVAFVKMHYTGEDLRDAVAQFTKKLHESLPALRCVGWVQAGGDSAAPSSP